MNFFPAGYFHSGLEGDKRQRSRVEITPKNQKAHPACRNFRREYAGFSSLLIPAITLVTVRQSMMIPAVERPDLHHLQVARGLRPRTPAW